VADETLKQVSFEPVDAEGAAITGLIVAVVIALFVGCVVALDILTFITKTKPTGPRRRRRIFWINRDSENPQRVK